MYIFTVTDIYHVNNETSLGRDWQGLGFTVTAVARATGVLGVAFNKCPKGAFRVILNVS